MDELSRGKGVVLRIGWAFNLRTHLSPQALWLGGRDRESFLSVFCLARRVRFTRSFLRAFTALDRYQPKMLNSRNSHCQWNLELCVNEGLDINHCAVVALGARERVSKNRRNKRRKVSIDARHARSVLSFSNGLQDTVTSSCVVRADEGAAL